MKLGKFIVAAGPVFLLAVGPALAAGGDSGLWNFSDKTVYQIDPTSSLGQMMKKAGRKGEPDKINNFPACLSPKTAQIFAPNPKSINPKLPNSDCVIQIVNQTIPSCRLTSNARVQSSTTESIGSTVGTSWRP